MMKSERPRTPILFLSDSPDLPSGLARIGRELATRVATTLGDKFKVGYLGRGGCGGDAPFPIWTVPHSLIGTPGSGEWGSTILRQVWAKLAGGDDARGIIFTINDAGRMIWLSRPEVLPEGPLRDWLTERPFRLWGYFPVDGHTPRGGLGRIAESALGGYDRVLAYNAYGAKVIDRCLDGQWKSPRAPTRYLPHGLDDVWSERDQVAARALLSLPSDCFLVGVVAANQLRKDWGLAAQTAAILQDRLGDRFRQWWHVDHMVHPRAWDLEALLAEFGLGECTVVSQPPVDDSWLAAAYSACDVTLGIGAGEGHGYPLAESQACGTPVVHWGYAGGAGLASIAMPVPAARMRIEAAAPVQRPVGVPEEWATAAQNAAELPAMDMNWMRWENCWGDWREWFEGGL